MFVQPETKMTTSYKITLTVEEKAQRKEMIDKLVDQVIARSSEYIDVKHADMKDVRRQVTRKYDAIIKRRVLESL